MVEWVKAQGKKPFEGWMIEFEALPEGHYSSRDRRPSATDDSTIFHRVLPLDGLADRRGFKQNCERS